MPVSFLFPIRNESPRPSVLRSWVFKVLELRSSCTEPVNQTVQCVNGARGPCRSIMRSPGRQNIDLEVRTTSRIRSDSVYSIISIYPPRKYSTARHGDSREWARRLIKELVGTASEKGPSCQNKGWNGIGKRSG